VKVLKPEDITPGAKQVHLYEFENVLRPRGSMLKESLGLYICGQLLDYHDSWSNSKYADNPDEFTLMKILKDNLTEEVEEVECAFATFLHCVKTGDKPWEVVYRKAEEES
jgi:hypothetical protein